MGGDVEHVKWTGEAQQVLSLGFGGLVCQHGQRIWR